MTIQLTRRAVAIALAAFLAFAGLATASFVRTLAPAEAGQQQTFSDVRAGTVFHPSVEWLAAHGIATGFADNTFRPNNSITRAQASSWFLNYNKTISITNDSTDPESGTQFNATATCPVGKRPVAGGGLITEPGVFMTASHVSIDQVSWRVAWESENNAIVDPVNASVFVTCVPGAPNP